MKVYSKGAVVGMQEGVAYVKNATEHFHFPCKAYLEANDKTREAFHKLSGLPRTDSGWLVRRAKDLSVAGHSHEN